MTRILVYSHDTFGLGNIRRMVRISEALVERDPTASVLIITGSPMLHAFRLPPRIDYVKLPCLARDTLGAYGVRHLDLDFAAAVRMRTSLILSAASDFEPDVILIDKKPLGVAGEVGPMLELLGKRPNPPSVHLLLRDILDTPEATRAVWQAHDYHGAIARHYESVLVVGDAAVFDMAQAYGFPQETRSKLRYCGYLDRARAELLAQPIRPDRDRTVLVHAGGGEDGTAVIEGALAALDHLGPQPGFKCRIIGGPELDPASRQRLAARTRALPAAEWLDFSNDMGREIAAADLIVAMGGYNSVCEILSYRKRAIIIPRSVPVREQRMRAEAMAELGLLRMIPAEAIDPAGLASLICSELDLCNVVQSRTARIRFTGLAEVCNAVLGNRRASVSKIATHRGQI